MSADPQSKATPGPWEYRRKSVHYSVYAPKSGNVTIAEVRYLRKDGVCRWVPVSPVTEANARLEIANG